MHRHSLTPIDTARRLLATERDQLRAERTAFERFADRVRSLDADRSVSTAPPSSIRPLATARTPATTEDVRRAYRETVMAVDHYENVYDEPLVANVRNELGPDIAAQIGDEAAVTTPFVDALLASVERSTEERASLLDHLEVEAASLKESRSTLGTVVTALNDRPVQDAGGTAEGPALESLGERCEAVIGSRQSLIQERHISPFIDGHDLCEYLYGPGDGDWTYPVLTVGATLQQDLEASFRRECPSD